MTQRTGNTSKRPSFADVKSAALKNIDRVLAHWLPNGKRVDGGKEYTAPNPTRTDKRAGSLKVNLSKGTWADFATGDKGGDLIDLVRYIDGGTDVEACKKLADLLSVSAGRFCDPQKRASQERYAGLDRNSADPGRGHEQVPCQAPTTRCSVQSVDLSRCTGPTGHGAVSLRLGPR